MKIGRETAPSARSRSLDAQLSGSKLGATDAVGNRTSEARAAGSCLLRGTGAVRVGHRRGLRRVVLVALDRFNSPWAIGLILLADVVPAMLLGPLFGAFADRWSRRGCAILADVLRAVAFLGLVLVDGFVATFLLALLAGVGTGLFTPAALAALPSLVEDRRLPAATSLFGAIADLGFIAGPAAAAAVLLVGGPETILAANAITLGCLRSRLPRCGSAMPLPGANSRGRVHPCCAKPGKGSWRPPVWRGSA